MKLVVGLSLTMTAVRSSLAKYGTSFFALVYSVVQACPDLPWACSE